MESPAGDRELRELLGAVSLVLGVPIALVEGDEWRVVPGPAGGSDGSSAVDISAVEIGLGFYARRGHGPREAVALAAVQLWEAVRVPRAAPARERRRRALGERRPELEPLLATIDRLQAAAEMLTMLPSLRSGLAAAAARTVPAELREQPRHLQWAALLLRRSLATGEGLEIDEAVRGEWAELERAGGAQGSGGAGSGGAERLLRRVLAPDPGRTPIRRWERALALLAPPYERLLARDAEDRGLADASGREGVADPDRDPERDSESGVGGAEGAGAGSGEHAERRRGEGGDDATVDPDARDPARPGDRAEGAEGSDLFEAERAGFVSTMLSTPLPTRGSLLEALLGAERRREAAAHRSGERAGDPGSRAGEGSGASRTPPADYLARVASRRAEIERIRELWARIVAERVARRPSLSRRPLEAGELLDHESLAGVVAEVRAGVAAPRAFRGREIRPRHSRRSGSTDYVLLVDRSASMQGAAAEAAASAALVLLESIAAAARDIAHAETAVGIDLELRLRVGLIAFAAEAEVVAPLSAAVDDRARRALDAAIRAPRGSTNDAAALRAAGEQLGGATRDGIARKRIAILLGDGGTNDPAAAAAELRRLRGAGVRVYGIGLGGDDIPVRYAPLGLRIDRLDELPGALLRIVEQEAEADEAAGASRASRVQR